MRASPCSIHRTNAANAGRSEERTRRWRHSRHAPGLRPPAAVRSKFHRHDSPGKDPLCFNTSHTLRSIKPDSTSCSYEAESLLFGRAELRTVNLSANSYLQNPQASCFAATLVGELPSNDSD